MSWFKTGESAHQEMDKEEERKIAASDRVFRYWMPREATTKVTFLDDQTHPQGFEFPFVFLEHNVFRNGNWKNWFTCIEGVPHPVTGKPQKCPNCEEASEENKVYLASACTVVDHTKWESPKTKGQFHQHELKLFVAKSSVQKTLRRHSKKREGLRGWLVEITRSKDNSPGTGDQFDFEKQFTDETFSAYTNGKFKTIPQPFNYPEIFAPKSEEELRDILAGRQSPKAYDPGQKSYSSTVDTEDDFVRF